MERFTEYVPGIIYRSGACRDAKDDKFLACEVEGKAHYLVSSDRDLLEMRYYQNVAIVNPGQFLLVLELHAMDEKAMAARFGRDTLQGIQANVPLAPEIARRVEEAIQSLKS